MWLISLVAVPTALTIVEWIIEGSGKLSLLSFDSKLFDCYLILLVVMCSSTSLLSGFLSLLLRRCLCASLRYLLETSQKLRNTYLAFSISSSIAMWRP